jgi:hypothetical protein
MVIMLIALDNSFVPHTFFRRGLTLRSISFVVMAAICAAVVAACSGAESTTDSPTSPLTSRASHEADIQEAVFRYQFAQDEFAQSRYQVYFLAFEGNARFTNRDPDDVFMNRFDGHQPPVRKASVVAADIMNGVFDKVTGERGIIFQVAKISWANDGGVEVEASITLSRIGATGHKYRVVLDDDKWSVLEKVLHWAT